MMLLLLVYLLLVSCNAGPALVVVEDVSVLQTADNVTTLLYQAADITPNVLFYNNTLYWCADRSILKYDVARQTKSALLTFPPHMDVTILTLDSYHGYMFWVDSSTQTVYISVLGEYNTPILHLKNTPYYNNDTLHHIQHLSCDPVYSLLFLAVSVGSLTQIYRVNYHGDDLTLLTHVPSTSVTFALHAHRLYFTDRYDSRYLNITSYNGTQETALELNYTGVKYAQIRDNTLYAVLDTSPGIMVTNLATLQQHTLLSQHNNIHSFVFVDSVPISGTLPCLAAHCTQLCYTSNTTAHCFCGPDYLPTRDVRGVGYCELVSGAGACQFLCHNARCVSNASRCDGVDDCWDNTDEMQCDNAGCVTPECDNAVTQCNNSQFQCTSGQCIGAAGRCDKSAQCADRSDEYKCSTCNSTDFHCTSVAECVPGAWKCDGYYDCSDLSDETNCSLQSECNASQIQCDTGRCLDTRHVCDSTVHCMDKADEINCPGSEPCPAGELACDSGDCISTELWCDGVSQCGDGSDEKCDFSLLLCNNNEHSCGNYHNHISKCIPDGWICDGNADCADGSDEQMCGNCTSFQCTNGRCISEKLQCNRHDDCGDNSDETTELCGYSPCSPALFECAPNECIPQSWRCNGDKDCLNGTDEVGCDQDNCVLKCDFKGTEQRCLPASARCNDIVDCVDGSDEAGCSTSDTCEAGQYRCKAQSRGTQCISIMFRCDGEAQCADGSDELHCDTCAVTELRCDNGTCLPATARCDGVPDCRDGTDESSCNGTVCRADEYRCRSGSCIRRHYLCDGHVDCLDGSDEGACTQECDIASYRCDNGACVTQHVACDGADDCGDGSDERNCAARVNECAQLPCDLTHSTCVDLPLGYYCNCDVGYRLIGTMTHCVDVDECENSTLCAQHCINVPGTYLCTCNTGYSLNTTDKSTCVPGDTPSPPLLDNSYTVFQIAAMVAVPLLLVAVVVAVLVVVRKRLFQVPDSLKHLVSIPIRYQRHVDNDVLLEEYELTVEMPQASDFSQLIESVS